MIILTKKIQRENLIVYEFFFFRNFAFSRWLLFN